MISKSTNKCSSLRPIIVILWVTGHIQTLAARKKMHSISKHQVIHCIYLRVAFSIIQGVILWVTICY